MTRSAGTPHSAARRQPLICQSSWPGACASVSIEKKTPARKAAAAKPAAEKKPAAKKAAVPVGKTIKVGKTKSAVASAEALKALPPKPKAPKAAKPKADEAPAKTVIKRIKKPAAE